MAISTKKELETKYLGLLNDSDVNRLEALFKVPNIFEILKIEQFEIRHSNLLAWLLNPKGNHGLGSNFIKKFLYDVASDERSRTFSVFDVNNLNFDSVSVHREWNNIDILIVSDKYAFIIENKINHKETDGQLITYKKLVEKTFENHEVICIFLNIDGYESTQNNIYINFSFESIISYLEQLLKIDVTINERAKVYIEDYISSVKNNIMENSEKFSLANKIYQNHKEIFDFVLSSRLDFYKELRTVLKDKIQKEQKDWILTSSNSAFIRFTTTKLNEIIASKTHKEWLNGEVFLFEIHFSKSQNFINPYYTVSRTEHQQRKLLINILKEIKEPSYNQNEWNCYRTTNPISIESNHNGDDKSYIDTLLNLIIQRASVMVEEAERLILPHKEQLTNTK